jgi:tetratricopeptide (TPR) repeat protein
LRTVDAASLALPVTTMKKPPAALLLSLTAMLATQLPLMAAALTKAEEARLATYEVQIFGKARPQLSDETRLRALENNLFGTARDGQAAARLGAMAKLLGGSTASNKSGFNPPLASQLDRSEFAPKPERTPDAVSPSSQPYDSPPPASTDDSTKQLLRTALAKHAEGKTAEAERIFKQVLHIDPRNADANFSLGTMAEQRGDLQGAVRYYKAADAANPSDYEIQDALTAIQEKLKTRQVAQQQAQQQKVNAQRQSELRGLAEQAATAYKNGDFDSAIAKLNKVTATAPRDANAQFALGQAWRGKGDYNRAMGYLNSALSIDPGNALYQTTMQDMQKERQQSQQQVAQNDPRPQGEITPFASDNRGGRGFGSPRGGLSGLFGDDDDNDDDGSANSQFGNSRGAPAYGWSAADSGRGGYAYASSGSRLGSAVAGSLMGAAVGAFTGRGMPGGVKRGMMQGALMGGLMGLIRN